MGKPYSIVRFMKYAPYKIKEDEALQSGVIKFTLEVITPLHVGSGMQFIDERNSIYKAFYKWNGRYAIPGATLKGCIRGVAESISHSCLSGKFIEIKKEGEKKKKVEYFPSVNKRENNGRCIICDMFGSMGIKSKINVSQLLFEKGEAYTELLPSFKNPHITESMLEDGKLIGYRFYHHGKINILQKGDVPFEVIKQGSTFSGKLHYKDLSQEELQLLCFSLGFSGDISLKLGYGKPAYFGSVRLKPDDEKYVEIAKAYKNTSDPEIKQAITQLCEILDYKNAKLKSEWNEDGTY